MYHVVGHGWVGWFRAVPSASGDTTVLYHSSGDFAQESCISGERNGFRIFSSLCLGEYILCMLPLMRKIEFLINGESHFLVEDSSCVLV